MSIIKDQLLYSKEEEKEYVLPIPDGTCNFSEYLFSLLDEFPPEDQNKDWIVNAAFDLEGVTETFGDVRRKRSDIAPMARSVGAALFNMGLRKGDVVQLVCPNSTDFHPIAIGVWMCQGIASLGDPTLTSTVLAKQLQENNAKIIVAYEATLSNVKKALQSMGKTIPVIVTENPGKTSRDEPLSTGFTYFTDILKQSLPAPPTLQGSFSLDDVATILWSSGTTGDPKGIQHSFKYMVNIMNIIKTSPYPIPSFMMTTCFFHAGGFLSPFSVFVSNYPIYMFVGQDLDQGPTTDLMFRAMDKYKIVAFACGTHHIVQLAQAKPPQTKLESVMFAMPVGAPIPPTIGEDLKKTCFPQLLGMANYYGLSELGQSIAKSFSPETLGGVAAGVVVKLVDPDTGTILGPNEEGEIMAKGEMVMKGYLNRPEENEKFFGSDGFIHTGDLGHYDTEGNLFYHGRIKELIKYKNCHMSPVEIEHVIQSHPDVAEVAVFGQPEPSVQELVTAAVVLHKGATRLTAEADIVELVNSKVEDAKKLRGGVFFVDSLPRNPQGKVQRRKLLGLIST